MAYPREGFRFGLEEILIVVQVLPTPSATSTTTASTFSTERWDRFCEENKEEVSLLSIGSLVGGYVRRETVPCTV